MESDWAEGRKTGQGKSTAFFRGSLLTLTIARLANSMPRSISLADSDHEVSHVPVRLGLKKVSETTGMRNVTRDTSLRPWTI